MLRECDSELGTSLSSVYGALLNQRAAMLVVAKGSPRVRAAYSEIGDALNNPAFPCLFAKRAWRDHSARFLYCADEQCGGQSHFHDGVLAYTQFVKNTPLHDRLFCPLIAVFVYGLRDDPGRHHAVAWRMLQHLLDRDPTPWPADLPRDPNDPRWTFCFDGVPLFFNISTPAHQHLRSRVLGQHLVLVINPRENFDVVASAGDRSGRLIREKIRSRVKAYNAGLVPAELGFYGEEDNYEWRQYQLAEPGLPGPSRCPLRDSKLRQ